MTGLKATVTAPPRWREVFGGALGPLTLGLFLLESLAAVEFLVVTTVLPVVVEDLGGLHLYGWAFSASGLAMVVAIPLTGQAVDRAGPRIPLAITMGIFAAGTVVAGVAPSMPVFVLGRFLQGAGAGGQYAVGLGTVAKVYPPSHRPRVLALTAVAWVLPGLLGPSFGALMASTIGWRWAFVTVVPLLAVSALLVFRGLGRVELPATAQSRLDVRRPVMLSIGSALTLAGLSELRPWSAPLVVAGLALAIPALVGLVSGQSGGLAGPLVAGFLLLFAFFAVDGFVPLLLTRVRARTVVEASVVVTLATVSWSLGSWWQSRVIGRLPRGGVLGAGASTVAIGTLGVAAGLLATPLLVPYLAWALAGLGMGVAYPTVYLVTMDRATAGAEATAMSLLILMDSLGAAIGAGLGGSAISVAQSVDASIKVGLGAAFGLAFVAAATLAVMSGRLAGARA